MTYLTPTDSLNYPTAIQIRDAAYSVLSGMTVFGGRVYKVRTLPTKDDELPILTIAYGGEQMFPDGDNNSSDPHFEHRFTLLISVMAGAGTSLSLDGSINSLAESVKTLLLTHEGFNRDYFESVEKFNTAVFYPRDGESLLCEVRMDIEFCFRSRWEPVVTTKLLEIVTTERLDNDPAADVIIDDHDLTW